MREFLAALAGDAAAFCVLVVIVLAFITTLRILFK